MRAFLVTYGEPYECDLVLAVKDSLAAALDFIQKNSKGGNGYGYYGVDEYVDDRFIATYDEDGSVLMRHEPRREHDDDDDTD